HAEQHRDRGGRRGGAGEAQANVAAARRIAGERIAAGDARRLAECAPHGARESFVRYRRGHRSHAGSRASGTSQNARRVRWTRHARSHYLTYSPRFRMTLAYAAILITVGIALLVTGILLGAGALLRPRHPTATKAEPFECGNPSSGPAWHRFDVKFYLTAI